MKIRLFLVFVILYILAAFGWWLYSLINFAKKEHEYELNSLIFKCNKIKESMVLYLYSKDDHKKMLHELLSSERDKITKIYTQLKTDYGCNSELRFNLSAQNYHDLISITPHNEEIIHIDKRFESKLRAFYSEAIVFTISVILGVLWVFSRLESLLNLNRMQNNFLLLVTHELKTPLAAIKLSAQAMSQRKLPEEIQKEVVSQTIQNADRLNDLIDNVLLATKIDGKSYNYDFQNINIVAVIKRAASQVLSPPTFKGMITIPDETHFVRADAISLNLVFSNLFQNSLKYAGENAKINVEFIKEDNKLKIILTDNGPGILQADRNRIFRKFYRSGDENTRMTKGTGLGLFLVKQILKVHKAKIGVESNENQGARFVITFRSI